MHGAYCCQHPHCVTLSPAAPTQCLYIMTYSTGVRLKTPTVKSQMEILVWNPQKCSCQVLIVWSLITDVCHQSPGMRHCHCWESEMPIIPRMMHWDQCWQSSVRPLMGHWPLIGRYCDGSCLHLGQRWKWWAWKMFGQKIFMNTWLWTHGWRSVNLILIQFPCPGYLLSTELCPMDHHYWRRLTLIISINNNPGLHSSG